MRSSQAALEALRADPCGARLVHAFAPGDGVHLVGGAVRDLLLERTPRELDLVVEGDVDAAAARLGGVVTAHDRFGTVFVRADGCAFDLVRARAESYSRPGALPDVRPGTLGEDLRRRDVTINAIALSLDGELTAVDGALEDLEAGVLRVLHDGSFADDPTRALRAARYAARYGFALEPRTAELLRRADLSAVSTERAEAELRRLASEPEARRGFELLEEWGLVELAPGAAELVGAVAELLDEVPWREVAPRPEAVLAAALGHGVSRARELVSPAPARPSEAVERARGRSGVELALARAQDAAWLDRYVEEWRHVRLEIDGNDLLAAGIPQGPAVGRGLARALRAKLDGEVAGREEELRAAIAAARENLP